MKAQHQAMAALLGELDASLPAWRAGADSADTDRVADILKQIGDTLEAHLGQEEEQILPVASVSMSQEEWDQLGKHGRSQIPKDRRLIQLGMMLESMPSADRPGWLKANVPPLARLLCAVVGHRQFVNHYRSVYGASPAA